VTGDEGFHRLLSGDFSADQAVPDTQEKAIAQTQKFLIFMTLSFQEKYTQRGLQIACNEIARPNTPAFRKFSFASSYSDCMMPHLRRFL
jgi:hypothetical protein